MDILRGKPTEKVKQFGHERLSTFGIGSELSEAQLRGVLRQLIATGALAVDAEAFNTLAAHRGLARRAPGRDHGDAARIGVAAGRARSASPSARRRPRAVRPPRPPPPRSTAPAQQRFAALKAWRAEVAREHNLPAYVIFHDATLAAIAARAPATLEDLQGISGIGAKKLEAYGGDVLRVCSAF